MSNQKPINFDLPSPETLAGIYVCVEGEEDLTIRPKQIPPQILPSSVQNGTQEASRQGETTNCCFEEEAQGGKGPEQS